MEHGACRGAGDHILKANASVSEARCSAFFTSCVPIPLSPPISPDPPPAAASGLSRPWSLVGSQSAAIAQTSPPSAQGERRRADVTHDSTEHGAPPRSPASLQQSRDNVFGKA
eukprot:scaffold96842_cov69-Phaeocystis_antarctica.AAC.1